MLWDINKYIHTGLLKLLTPVVHSEGLPVATVKKVLRNYWLINTVYYY